MPNAPVPVTWESYARELGVVLQRRRIAAGETQENLAHKAGLTRTHYQQLERGFWKKGQPANPSLKILARLAQALELQIADLLLPIEQLGWDDEAPAKKK